MESNKENEDKSIGTSKIPVLIRSLPKSGRPQPKVQQQRLLKTVARGPLTTLAFQRVNQELASSSNAQTRRVPKFVINEKYLQNASKEMRNPLKTLTCVNQNVVNSRVSEKYPIANKIIPYLNSGQDKKLKCLAGHALSDSTSDKEKKQRNMCNLENPEVKSESKIPILTQLQRDQNITKRPIPLTFNSNLENIGINPILAGPSSQKRDSFGNISQMCKIDGMIAAFKKDKILASSLDNNNFFTPPLELGSVKKVKRSLKRPHSRGLQSLPPFDIDLKNDVQKVDSEDTEKKSNESAVPVIDNLTHCYTTDALHYLLDAERKPIGSSIPDDCRSCVINYMMQLNGSTGPSAVVQSSVWYMDSLCSTPGFLDQLRLTAAACLWIASKFHIGAIHGMRMVRRSNNTFAIQDLALAEKRVLHELKFPTHPVIPQDYIPYLCWWCDPDPGIIEAAATFLCLCGLTVSKRIGLEFASVVAVASVKTALILLRKEEQGKKLEECPVYHSAMKKADISTISAVLRESLYKMSSVNYEYKVALIHYSQKPYCIAPKLAYANHFNC